MDEAGIKVGPSRTVVVSSDYKILKSDIEYRLIRSIGKGSFAKVYLARRVGIGLDRYVAVKVVDLDGMNERQRSVIMDEAKITGVLSHPNILHIYDCGMVADRYFFIVCELLDGYTLRDIIRRHTDRVMDRLRGEAQIPLSLMKNAVASVAIHTVHGLNYIHHAVDVATGQSIRVIHNDLKPSNILIGMNGSLKVSDFGISYSPLRTVKLKGGTPAYMSPEYLKAIMDNEASLTPTVSLDIYSLGICLYETLTDRRLFTAPREGMNRNDLYTTILQQMQNVKPGLARQTNPAADPEISRIVDRCLEFDPTNRYVTVYEILKELEALIEKGYFHPEILDRYFLRKYMESLYPEGCLRRYWKANPQ